MDNPFDSVKDSTIWFKSSDLSLVNQTDSKLYIGVVRSTFNDKETNELRYLVEVRHTTDVILTSCRMLRQFGGVYNYEDYVLQDYNFSSGKSGQNGLAAKAGDIVVVGSFAGQTREGVILGGITHPARKTFLDVTKGPQYRSEFNGIETHINEDGEYKLTFRGLPTNIADLKKTPDATIAAPTYDTKVGTSYLQFDKKGNFIVSDKAESDLQRLFIDKENGEVYLDSGKISLKFTKKTETVHLQTKITNIDTTESITVNTKATTYNSSNSFTLNTLTTKVDSTASITVSTAITTITSSASISITTGISDLTAATKATITAPTVFVVGTTFLGVQALVPMDGVVTGQGIDTLTGVPYFLLGNASTIVFAKK